MPRQHLLVAPHFEREGAVRRFRIDDDMANTTPAAFLVEPGRAIVAYRTGEPCGCDAGFGHASFGVRDQRRRCAGTARLCGDIELIELVALDDGEPNGYTGVVDD